VSRRNPPHPGELWRQIIDDGGWTQADVARAMGCSTKHLNQVVQGVVVPTADLTVRFSTACGVSVYLMWQVVAD
jgi:plasmid maintenance system antidote protein VapI